MAEMAAASLPMEHLEDSARRRARRLLADAAESIGGVNIATELREGRPVDELLRLATDSRARLAEPVEVLAQAGRERAAALIVTGTRGRNVLSSALLGSVSAGVVRSADRPVALVPPSAGDAPEIG